MLGHNPINERIVTNRKLATWEDHVKAVTDVMNSIVGPVVVPMSNWDGDQVRLVGTGTLVTLNDRMFILTCKHVATEGGNSFTFYENEDVQTALGGFITPGGALDSAVLPISAIQQREQGGQAGYLEVEQFAERYDPVPRELFFFRGYSQENSAYGFGTLETNASGVGTQVNESFESEDRFFYLVWHPHSMQFTPSTSDEAKASMRKELANGFSGALVFDTGFVRAMNERRAWSPANDPRVVGQVVNWDQQEHQIVARRIEDVTTWMRAELAD